MTFKPFSLKFLGKTETVYRVRNAAGELVHVADSEEAAAAWIAAH